MQFTAGAPSPEIFRRWAAVSAISGALERKVWTKPYGFNLYPNTYVILVGPAGVGKSIVTSRVQRLWKELTNHHVGKTSLTKASLMDDLRDATRHVIRPGENPSYIEFHFLNILSNELGVFIPAYDAEFMSALTDVWDGHGYSERRRGTKEQFELPNAQINLLAGTTPAYLGGTMPATAWDQGFLSRTMLVFSGDSQLIPLFQSSNEDAKGFTALADDLKIIGNLFGPMTFTTEAAELIGRWHMAGGPPTPEHPKLTSYCARRTAHLIKLCMIVSASSADNLKITEEHFIEALDLLVATEAAMPEIFKAMSTGGDQRAMEDLWYHILQLYAKTRKPVGESFLIAFLSERVPSYSVMKIIEVMVKSKIFSESLEPSVGKAYTPRPRKVAQT